MVPPEAPFLGRNHWPGTPATVAASCSTSSERTNGGSTAPHRSSRTSSIDRNSSMRIDAQYPMNDRIVSRVTATARL